MKIAQLGWGLVGGCVLCACPVDPTGMGSAGSSSGTAPTGDADTAMADTVMPGTGDTSPPSDSSGGGTTTSATGVADSGSGSDSGPSEDSSTGDPPPPTGEYGPCGPGGACEIGSCFEYRTYNMCLPDCDRSLLCPPPPPESTSFAECIGAVGVRCMINCVDGGTCAAGSECVEIPIGGGESVFRCLWPV